MVRTLLFIFIGGGLGSMLRYLISFYFSKHFPNVFPYGTFVVNIIGCLLIGLFFGLTERLQWNNEWRIFLTVGFCGGFTTFSAFALENVKLLQEGNYLGFSIYTVASIIVGIVAVFLGIFLLKI